MIASVWLRSGVSPRSSGSLVSQFQRSLITISHYLMGGGLSGGSSSSYSDQISTHSVESMVEIVQHPPQQPETPGTHRLLYSKSKVYVHPTAFSRDNIPGFVAIVKKVRFNLDQV